MSSTLSERTLERKKRIVTHVATDFLDADSWDLDFWQKQTPAQRLDALVVMHEEVEAIRASKKKDTR